MLLEAPARSFEALFRIPPEHHLEQVRSRSRGGLITGVYWDHHEYDASGRLIATYHSYSEAGENGACRAGWRKYDDTGRLVAEGTSLTPAT